MTGLQEHTERWTVRTYEVDENAHVNKLAEIASEWVWVRLSDGRPSAVPREIVDAYRAGAEEAGS